MGSKILHEKLQKGGRAHSDPDDPPQVLAIHKEHGAVVVYAAPDMAKQQHGRRGTDQEDDRLPCHQQQEGHCKAEQPDEAQGDFSRTLLFAKPAQSGKGQKAQPRTDKPCCVDRMYGVPAQQHSAALVYKRLGQHKRKKAQGEAGAVEKICNSDAASLVHLSTPCTLRSAGSITGRRLSGPLRPLRRPVFAPAHAV